MLTLFLRLFARALEIDYRVPVRIKYLVDHNVDGRNRSLDVREHE